MMPPLPRPGVSIRAETFYPGEKMENLGQGRSESRQKVNAKLSVVSIAFGIAALAILIFALAIKGI